MFGIGTQEMLVIGLLALVVFGPGKLPGIARDLGKFVRKAQHLMDEFRSGISPIEGGRGEFWGRKGTEFPEKAGSQERSGD